MNIVTSTLLALAYLSVSSACTFDSSSTATGDLADGAPEADTASTSMLSVVSNSPLSGATNVLLTSAVVATFSEDVDPATLRAETFTVATGGVPVAGSFVYENFSVSFEPTEPFDVRTTYTATITNEVTSASGVPLERYYVWSFTSGALKGAVNLGTARRFVLLSNTGITSAAPSVYAGDVGVNAGAATITGLAQVLDASGVFAKSTQVSGEVLAADYADPTPLVLTVAVADMATAYDDAAGRFVSADNEDLGTGVIGGLTFSPGVYHWASAVSIASAITIEGGPTDIWIFQLDGGLDMTANITMELAGGALPENIYWQVGGAIVIGAGAHFEGSILGKLAVGFGAGASINGRILSQDFVTAATLTATP